MWTRRRITALIGMAALALVGLPAPAGAVANGEEVPNGMYRFSVKLTMTGIPTADGGRRDSACSGALIARQWIITAGHCFRDFNGVRVERPVADLTTATVGRADLDGTGGDVRTVVAVRQSATNDVAVAKLDRPIFRIWPIQLSTTAPQVGEVLRLTGYGSITGENPTPSSRLRTGQLQITTVNADTLGLTGHAPQRDTTPCPYDSGAPFFRESPTGALTLVATVSDGPSCPHVLDETAARVDVIVPWIRDVTGARAG